ncbi:MAG: 4-hydroxy-tetrahydrodipicolinate synthase [Cytophagales bacterium]|jgi:4-hydroxy-tetrahydrodipicolinate synthase|nr:4-hydroxy-tetrahydrodipicolinate synthase [Bacteroidota bacterium]MBS1980584.1 4-hydroxy-tetrahydrodipicolinate synthase [Bacteroidota bacterium]WHZ07906.1 MAG: 4-hydroxy-tetrahydrodipicolinate synthase [Cytophagales bacterium]
MKRLHGTGVALVTPFNADGSIDFSSLKRIINHTAKGVDYFVVMGTTGESATLTKEEKKEVLRFVLKTNFKKLPVVYGIGGNNTASVLEEIRTTDLKNVDALLSVSPYYNKPSQEGIYQHFVKVADASPVPVILYNVPGRTSSNLTASTTLRLAQHKNIVAIKEASGNLEQCMKIAREKPKDFLLISGDDLLTVPIYSIGGAGVISVLANAYPIIFKKMTGYAAQGNFSKASTEAFKLLDINGPMYEEGNPTGVKYLMSLLGLCKTHVRLPLVEPSEELKKKIEGYKG